MSNKQLIIGITGASGAIYGIKMLQILQETDIQTHLIISKSAQITIAQETNYTYKQVLEMADFHYQANDIAARISSGSFQTMGMIIAPCSVRTLSEIATSISSSLMTRAADVILKERRKLVLMVRETPLHSIHLQHMTTLSQMGAIIAPPVVTFYNHPNNIDDMIKHNIGRTLDLFNIDTDIVKRWDGIKSD